MSSHLDGCLAADTAYGKHRRYPGITAHCRAVRGPHHRPSCQQTRVPLHTVQRHVTACDTCPDCGDSRLELRQYPTAYLVTSHITPSTCVQNVSTEGGAA